MAMEEVATNLLSNGLAGVPKDALFLVVIWYMLKDIKALLVKFESRLEHLEKNSPTTKLALIEQETARIRDDLKDLRSAYDGTTRETSKEFKAVWGKVGTRPGDRNRQGGCDDRDAG